ncbi:MAG: hypothetical protein K6F33_14020 [Bacteroidales bacterium]|nr:hypothetical protein [Bacteroidales bacterium]
MNQKLSKYFDKSQLTKLGEIVAFKGTKGDVLLRLYDPNYDINSKEPVLVEIDGYLVPFFIQEDSVFYSKNGDISLRFDTISSNEDAAKVVRKVVYVSNDDLVTIEDEEDEYGEFKYANYDVFDQNDMLLGKIVDIHDIPGNPLIIIHNAFGEEILVPLNAAEILAENDTIRTIKITIPDGLLDINR